MKESDNEIVHEIFLRQAKVIKKYAASVDLQ